MMTEADAMATEMFKRLVDRGYLVGPPGGAEQSLSGPWYMDGRLYAAYQRRLREQSEEDR